MAHNYLDEFAGLTRAFTIVYRITDDSGDSWTARFNRFKTLKLRARKDHKKLFDSTLVLAHSLQGAKFANAP